MISRGLMTARVPCSRSIQFLLAPAGTLAPAQTAMPYMAVRSFAKKRGKRAQPDISDFEEDEDAASVPKAEPTPEPEPVHAEPEPVQQSAPTHEPVSKNLFSPFSVGDIKQVDSVPDNKALSKEDTIEGRYAGVLFTTASLNGCLFDVYEDMQYLKELYKHCEVFRMFTENAGVGLKEIAQLNEALQETAPFSAVTLRFLEVLAENKRLVFIKEISEKYAKLYAEVNKEEKVTIISAKDLSSDQKNQIIDALKANPQNEGKEFTVQYEIDEHIMGGLQMYTESEFMDMSLASRVTRINAEIEKLTM